MKKYILFFGVLFFALGCNNQAKRVTPSGLTFRVIKSGKGRTAEIDEMVLFHLRIVDSNDSVWLDSRDTGYPMSSLTGDPKVVKELPLKQMFRMLIPGDSVVVDFTASDYFASAFNSGVPEGVDPSLKLSYQVLVDRIIPVEAYAQWLRILQVKNKKKRLKEDGQIIDSLLKNKGNILKESKSGIRYFFDKQVSSNNAKSGQIASINYKGYLIDGTCFDTNIKSVAIKEKLYDAGRNYSPYKIVIDSTAGVSGLHEAIKLMGLGDRATFYIPSTLGYGSEKVSNKIEPNSILVFEIELIGLE